MANPYYRRLVQSNIHIVTIKADAKMLRTRYEMPLRFRVAAAVCTADGTGVVEGDEVTTGGDERAGGLVLDTTLDVTCSLVRTVAVAVGVGAVITGLMTTKAVEVQASATIVVVVPKIPAGIVGIAYGGSNRPNLSQAPQGDAQDFTRCGAARMGLHRPSSIRVAMPEGAAVVGQSVPRSLSSSCRVAPEPGAIVETSFSCRAKIRLLAEGPVGLPEL